jgi:hypothetical protein
LYNRLIYDVSIGVGFVYGGAPLRVWWAMSEEVQVRVRRLPAGEFRDGFETGWTGRILEIEFVDGVTPSEMAVGAPLEVEMETRLCLGVLQASEQSSISILVEHSLESGQIGWIRDVWG